MTKKAQWQEVADCTHRLRVPGGWIYRYKYGGFFSLAFVPSEPIEAEGGRE